ncbi:bifunctional diaminohydroxyphosphoribosylaminopyrimidine deaminase/5-amino-6-(5-phosphoribosylamino)uracil reductase RibD, partial [Senegalimassilia anaerobia]|uniref:bifunctional diaminohydroxyphosphoribosylaminopyrimidine deaminase/5-amino-6-(5-phosphoribosylamino)uracil reductase RibD n=1 Tax=Senegalimassilia anaerobia TaxID=1473216 RepID=UPI00026D2FF9
GDPARGHARGATAYVTLEPCCHTGKQPPCTEALIAAGVARVVVGSRDPNPLVAGKGSARLREAGIRVDEDALRDECDELNPIFFRFISRKTPYVVAKWAMSADGKIACASGDARWVSGPESRRDTHDLRHRLAAIAVGIGTVMADDPLLTCRREGEPGNQPLRVVLDSHLRIPEDCALVRSCAQDEAPLAVATCAGVDDPATYTGAKAQRLHALGVEVLRVPQDGAGHVAIGPLLRALGEKGIDSLLVEGGSGIHGAFFDEGAVDEAVVYLAPKVVGGATAPGPVAGAGAARMAEAAVLGRPRAHALGDDLKITFAPAGAARVADRTPASRNAFDARTPAMEGGDLCSPAS